MRLTYSAEVRVERPEQLEELVRLAANAEIGLTIFDDAQVGVADAEAEVAAKPSNGEQFTFDRAKAAQELGQAGGAISVANPYSDADEIHTLAEAALRAGIIAGSDSGTHIYVYPMSLSEPDPMVAVEVRGGLTLLGYSLRMSGLEGESPVSFTLRLLEEIVAEANSLISRHLASRPAGSSVSD